MNTRMNRNSVASILSYHNSPSWWRGVEENNVDMYHAHTVLSVDSPLSLPTLSLFTRLLWSNRLFI